MYCAAGFAYKTFQQTADGEYSKSELDNALTNDAQAELDSSKEKLDVDSPSEDNDSDLQNQVQVNQNLSLASFGKLWLFPMCNEGVCNNKTY